MDTILCGLRHELRMFRQSGMSFMIATVIALGLGIGANTAIFPLVNTVLCASRRSPTQIASSF